MCVTNWCLFINSTIHLKSGLRGDHMSRLMVFTNATYLSSFICFAGPVEVAFGVVLLTTYDRIHAACLSFERSHSRCISPGALHLVVCIKMLRRPCNQPNAYLPAQFQTRICDRVQMHILRDIPLGNHCIERQRPLFYSTERNPAILG